LPAGSHADRELRLCQPGRAPTAKPSAFANRRATGPASKPACKGADFTAGEDESGPNELWKSGRKAIEKASRGESFISAFKSSPK
jgi:hypothetical protein